MPFFPFLSLPPELRNQIYHLMLTTPTALILLAPYRRFPSPSRPATPLLQTCRQIHREASPALYAANEFQFVGQRAYHTLGYFLRQIGRVNVALLTRVAVSWPRVRGGLCARERGKDVVVVERAMRELREAGSGSLVLHVFHRGCAADVGEVGHGGAGMVAPVNEEECLSTHIAISRLLGLAKGRKMFHASPVEVWTSDPYFAIIEDMRMRGWAIGLYENDCLEPGAVPRLFSDFPQTTAS